MTSLSKADARFWILCDGVGGPLAGKSYAEIQLRCVLFQIFSPEIWEKQSQLGWKIFQRFGKRMRSRSTSETFSPVFGLVQRAAQQVHRVAKLSLLFLERFSWKRKWDKCFLGFFWSRNKKFSRVGNCTLRIDRKCNVMTHQTHSDLLITRVYFCGTLILPLRDKIILHVRRKNRTFFFNEKSQCIVLIKDRTLKMNRD